MTCATIAGSGTANAGKFDTGQSESALSIGTSYNVADAFHKDVRYYYADCLTSGSMAAIYTSFKCKQMCQTCSDPDTCTQCISGFTLSGGECVGMCSGGKFAKSGTCVSSCGSNFWG